MKIKVIITGTTGMVGKGVLLECLDHPEVETVLVVNRTSVNVTHPKLTEILLSNFFDLYSITDQLSGYNACFFCLGVSAAGMDEREYMHYTYDLTKYFAETVAELNPNMTFNYVSGAGTDHSENGGSMWARVKGRTENFILSLPFKQAYMFRPGTILPENGVKSKVGWYNSIYMVLRPIFPLLKQIKSITTSSKVGKAMINSVLRGYKKKYLKNRDINRLAKG